MIAVITAALGGSVLGTLFFAGQKARQPTLADRLMQAEPFPTGREPPKATRTPGLLISVRRHWVRWDERYQAWVQTRLDPVLAGRSHNQQLRSLNGGAQRQLQPVEKRNNRRLLLGVAGLGLLAMAGMTGWPLIPAVMAIGLYTGWPWFREAWRVAIEEHRFSLLHLMLAYLVWLWVGGYYWVCLAGTVFNTLCRKTEFLTQMVTRHTLTHLLAEQPSRVWVVLDGVEVEIPFEQLRRGDILVLTAGQMVPVDGVVVQGAATVDQHRLTGESQPAEKAAGDPVLAATLVLGGRLQVRVEKTGAETAAARIGEVLERTVERQEIRIADQYRNLEKTRLPTLAGGTLGWLVGGPTTAVAMLGCNCLPTLIPLRLLTLLNGLKAGAERGILVKDGRGLERLPKIDTVVFDKTGTLTLAQQQVVRIHCRAGRTEAEVLGFAAAAEQRQNHPIAQAILAAAAERALSLPPLDEAHYQLGYGLTVRIRKQRIRVGSERFLAMQDLDLPAGLRMAQKAAHGQGHALVFVAEGEEVVGAVELAAILRPETHRIIAWLRRQGLALYILSGDQDAPTRKLAGELGMDGYFANTLPEQKAEQVRELQAQGRRVCFIGDGINDAIALRQADVSLSLRGATTIATDAAQIVLMDDDLTQLQGLWELARDLEGRIAANSRQAVQLSLLAAAGVLCLPFKFWIVELMWNVNFIAGLNAAVKPLQEVQTEAGEPVPAVPEIRAY